MFTDNSKTVSMSHLLHHKDSARRNLPMNVFDLLNYFRVILIPKIMYFQKLFCMSDCKTSNVIGALIHNNSIC